MKERILHAVLASVALPAATRAGRHTSPKMSSGSPVNAVMLLRSDVRSSVARVSVGARVGSGGEPQSCRVCSGPIGLVRQHHSAVEAETLTRHKRDERVMSEYSCVYSRLIGCPESMIE
jgi:hypothetical protein